MEAVGKPPRAAFIEELVEAHQRAKKLLSEAQARLADLKDRAEHAAELLSE